MYVYIMTLGKVRRVANSLLAKQAKKIVLRVDCY